MGIYKEQILGLGCIFVCFSSSCVLSGRYVTSFLRGVASKQDIEGACPWNVGFVPLCVADNEERLLGESISCGCVVLGSGGIIEVVLVLRKRRLGRRAIIR